MRNPFKKVTHVIDIVVNKKEKYVAGTLGIGEGRRDEIHSIVHKGIEKYDSVCDVMQLAVDEAKITDPRELIYTGFFVKAAVESYQNRHITMHIMEALLK